MPVPDVDQNATRCICPGCPTYDDCMRGKSQRLFCSRGESDCQPRARTCMCGDCPVWKEFSLGDYYFCIEGAAR